MLNESESDPDVAATRALALPSSQYASVGPLSQPRPRCVAGQHRRALSRCAHVARLNPRARRRGGARRNAVRGWGEFLRVRTWGQIIAGSGALSPHSSPEAGLWQSKNIIISELAWQTPLSGTRGCGPARRPRRPVLGCGWPV